MLTTLYLGRCPRLCADPAPSGRMGDAIIFSLIINVFVGA